MTTKEKVINLKKEHPDWGYRKIGCEIGISRNTVRFHLSELCRKGNAKRNSHRKRNVILRLKQGRGGKCERCGYSRCLDALQFHHTTNNKVGNVSELVRLKGFSIVEAEAAKCELICANCHAEEHSNSCIL